MAPLVGYDSSDDDDHDDHNHDDVVQVEKSSAPAQTKRISQDEQDLIPSDPKSSLPPPQSSFSAQGPAPGPSLPPADDGGASAYPEDVDLYYETPERQQEQGDLSQPPSSPYTTARTLIHNLTLPTIPNLDIPPSPPPSPSQAEKQAALTAKFDRFIELKRKKNIHFNAKIADNHALKNPPLMDKLFGFAGIATNFDDGEGTGQYATTLDKDLWDPACFPEWAYRGPLRKAQEQMQKEKGRLKGQGVQFVPPTTSS